MKPEYRVIEIKMGDGSTYYNLQKKTRILLIPMWVTVVYTTGRTIRFEDREEVDRHIRAAESDRLRKFVVSRTIIKI